ncbi:hypothetical protein MHU86_17010 [Fragilaria crotonensis]|nr:hypothetical protein MHU86_17010 [Fragilaria crotonensis]
MKTLTFISACLAIAAVGADMGKGGVKVEAPDSGSRDVHGKAEGGRSYDDDDGYKADTKSSCLHPFESTFVIVYSGPQEVFDESNPDAIIFLQETIRDVYNTEVSHHSERVLDTVTLQEQSLMLETAGNTRELQSSIGLRYRLLNVYSASGRCRNCRRNSNLLNNDAARNLGSGRYRRRELHVSQGTGISRFNFFLVERLTSQNEFETFLSITDASISDSVPSTLTAINAPTSTPTTNANGSGIDSQPTDDEPPTGDGVDFTWVGSLSPVNFTNDSQDDPLELVGGISNP